MPDPVVHYEIPVNDVDKMSKFYKDAVGWKFKKETMEGGEEYWLIDMGSKTIAGGMMKRMDPNQKPTNYVGVKSIDAALARFKNAGGQVIMEKMEVPKQGWVAIGLDPEGNSLGFWQAVQAPRRSQRPKAKSKAKRKK